jgi:ribonuclease HII
MARHAAPHKSFLPIEAEAWAVGYRCIAGIDEAGRGPLAGPVVAAAVILPRAHTIPGLQDSKRLTVRQREVVYGAIRQCAVAYGIGIVSHRQIDQYDILWATKTAMLRAVQHLEQAADMLLIDGTERLPTATAQRSLVRGDARCASIAAASVLAKVTRDRLMMAYAQLYPAYGFEQHKGYPTQQHYARLRRYGPCAIHRRSFRGVVVPPVAEDGAQP